MYMINSFLIMDMMTLLLLSPPFTLIDSKSNKLKKNQISNFNKIVLRTSKSIELFI